MKRIHSYLLARLYRKIGDSKDAAEALEQMKSIKQQRRDRGVKLVEDPDLSALESRPAKRLHHSKNRFATYFHNTVQA